MKWAHPEWLHLLWLLVPLALAAAGLARQRRRRLAALADESAWRALLPDGRLDRLRPPYLPWILAIGLGIVALARPQWGFHWEEVKRRGLDILVVLDTSRSMTAQDIKPNRLQQAKWGIRDLIQKLRGDRIGLVAFAGGSFLQCPLTVDYAAFRLTLDDIYCGIIPRGGTAIEQALRTAIESFDPESRADRAIVLITDGEDHEGHPLSVVEDLKKLNIRVYAIGIGSREGDLIPDPEPTSGGFFKDRQGRVVKTALQEDVLQQLALATGGAYVRSAPGETGLERVFDEGLANLKREEGESKTIKAFEDRFQWFVAGSLALLAADAARVRRRRGKESAT